MGLLLLTLIISRLALHSWLLIEIYFNVVVFNGIAFNELTFVTCYRIVNPIKNIFLTNLNIFIYTVIFFIKYLWMSLISSTSVALQSTLKS